MTLSSYFGPWTSPKCDLDEVEKTMIQVVECHFEVVFCFLTKRNCEFFQVDKRIFKRQNGIEIHFLLLEKPKIRL